MKNRIIDLQNSDTSWKIQFTIAVNVISSKVAEEEHVMNSWSYNIKFTSYNDANEVVCELFELVRSRYQGKLWTSIRGSDFIFYSVQMIYYRCHLVNFRRDGSCTDSPDWIKKEKKQQ